MDDERLLDNLTRPHPRVERRVRILKHDLHVASRFAQPPARKCEHIFPSKTDVAGRRFDEPQQAAARRRLAAARFADQPERFALFDREAHVVDGVHDGASAQKSTVPRELFDQVGDFDGRHQLRLVAGGWWLKVVRWGPALAGPAPSDRGGNTSRSGSDPPDNRAAAPM